MSPPNHNDSTDDSIDEITNKLNSILKIKHENTTETKEKFIAEFYNDENSDSDENNHELIARGPAPITKTKRKSHPYELKPFSPYTSSDSSLGSPPSLNLLTVFPNTIIDENGLSVSPNRKQYMHKNGGEFIINKTPSPQASPIPNSYFTHSPTSDYSSSAYESDATTDSFCPLVADESSGDDVVSDLMGLIEDRTAKDGNKLDLSVYHQEIDKILLNLDMKEVECCRLSPIPVTVVESEVKLKNEVQTSLVANANVSVVRPVLVTDLPGYVLCRAVPMTYPKYRPIKMKCETNGNDQTTYFDAEAIRNDILKPFNEKEKITVRCWASKLTDDQLMSGDDDGDRPLHIAIINRMTLASVCLINVMANLNPRNLDVRNDSGETPLFLAATLKQVKIVEYLLAKGSNPNESCLNTGETVLHHLAQFGSHFESVIDIFCRLSTTKIDSFDKCGRTPLISAIESHGRLKKINENQSEIIDSVNIVRYLIRHGASLACQEKRSGKTPFHVSINDKCLDILQVLCSFTNGLNEAVNCPNYSGQTPLHYAAVLNDLNEKEQIKFIKLLLNAGSCIKVTNREHKTAADLVDRGRDEARKLLLNRQRRLK